MTDRKTAYKEWVAKHKKAKTKLASYKCPGCEIRLETLTPPPRNFYDSMAFCPFCNDMHYKIVTPDGKVKIN